MSASSEFEPTARQDYGPTTSSQNVYEHVLDHKLADNMSSPSIRTPEFRAVPLSPTEGDPEPDSTNPESIAHSTHSNLDKEVEFHISEKCANTDMAVDSLSGIVRIEEATIDNCGRIAYPIVQEADDSSDATYAETTSATLIQAPLSTAIVQNVTKLAQNFAINVDATVGNITAIQNVSQDASGSSQTLWLPTLLATSAATDKPEDDRSQAAMSQIIITSESYVSNDTSQAGARRPETNYMRPKTSKVQILSNVSIPKTPTYTQQYVTTGKDVAAPVYGTQNHVYKLNASVISQKHFNNSVLTTKSSKSQSLIGAATVANPIKSVPYTHSFTKGTNINKTLNKVNNGANLNAVVAATSGNTQCHILSRVVSGPNKMAVHSGRKSVNTFKGSKGGAVSHNQKQSRAIKIIQQTGAAHKSDGKSWPVANVATYKTQQTYGVVEINSKIIQKVGSPTHKQAPMALQNVAKGERLVLQSPCGPVLISTAPISTSMPKGPHYVQSGPTPNLRYVHSYGTENNQLSSVSQVSANQQLTAQILQSLSQPKLMLPQSQNIINHGLPPPADDDMDIKPANQKRLVFGDPSTLLTTDDIQGLEERPNLSEELRRYSFQPLAFVMLDHNYALPSQKTLLASQPPVASVPTPASPEQVSLPMSPMKQTSPVVTSTTTYELQHLQPLSTVHTGIIGAPIPISSIQMYKPQPVTPHDDDAGSVISSAEADRRPGDVAAGGSDTETAPEEEEGKTRCICDFSHDDGYMICCDRCGEWQHVDCMGIDRNNIPENYMCELCHPRSVDRRHARAIQMRKREELSALVASDTDSSDATHARIPGQRRKRLLTVTTYTNTSGSCVTTYNAGVPVLPPLPAPSLTLPKRGPKRPKKAEVVRKGTKRKLTEKRVRRKKEMMLNRSKYSSSLSNQSHWQESFESAMTNHYSPELRAKIMKYSSKLGNMPNMASAITAHLCTTVPHAGGKILIATKDLRENTPVIELRGKYMLSNQHKPQIQNTGRAGSQKPGPFVFFYRLPKDNTQICIDTRTYGNEARFVRRSCKPNAELQHCIVKGALHVYLVTIGTIQSNTEITVGHDGIGSKQPCACGNPKHCKVNGLSSMLSRKSIDYPPREKRSRNRCLSISSPLSPPPAPALTPVKETPHITTPIKSEKKSPVKQEYPKSPIKSVVTALNFDQPIKTEMEFKEEKPEPEMDLTAKEEMKPETDETDFAPCPEPEPHPEPEPYPEPEPHPKPALHPEPAPHPEPALEELPKPEPEPIEEEEKEIKLELVEEPILIPMPEPPKAEEPEAPIQNLPNPKVEESIFSDEENMASKIAKVEKVLKAELKGEDTPVTREVRAKSACHDRSSRSSRTTCVNQDSLDDKTDDSQDKLPANSKEKDKKKMTREERKMEAIMKAFERMEKAEQRKQEVKERQKRRESDPHPHAPEKDEDDDAHITTKRRRKRKGRARTTSQSNRRRLNSADSDMVTSGDEAPPAPPRRVSAPTHHSSDRMLEHDRSHETVREDLGLSSACLLVEAAVGSVESAFKLPKTKKTMATEWLGRSPERTPSPYQSPYRSSLVSATSLESLVRVASTMIGDLSGQSEDPENELGSPPRTPSRERYRPPKKFRRVTRSTPPTEVAEVTPAALPQHCAKKRWLRQAISEESDSPVAESPPNEMVTPLKKRRVARESLCAEANIVPLTEETSPNLTSEESPVKEDSRIERPCTVRNIMESLYSRDRTRSDSGQGSDDQCNMEHDVLNLNLRGPHDSEHIRRIIGVPLPEGPPVITKVEDIKTINNNVGESTPAEDSSYTKVVPMEIDTTIAQPQIKDGADIASEAQPPQSLESPREKLNSSQSQSADTSGNSSPQRDEMDDIQKKIHSFHTENIQILKSRNKKPPKEKRKKVNLNFDLNMVDDQISVRLRTEDINGDIQGDPSNTDPKIHYIPIDNVPLPAIENIPLPDEPVPLSDAKIHYVPIDNIPMPSVETIPLPAIENIPLPDEPLPSSRSPADALLAQEDPVTPAVRPQSIPTLEDTPLADEPSPNPEVRTADPIPLREEPLKPLLASPVATTTAEKQASPIKSVVDKPSILENSPVSTVPFASRFSSTGLFSGIFNNMNQSFNSLDSQINENVPNMHIIKSAIDRTTSLESSMFDKDSITPGDDLKSVQEILTRVNNMDSNNSVLLSGVLKSSDQSNKPTLLLSPSPKTPTKSYCPRSNDPRLNPPPADKPKPVRRKLSITEYRKRHKGGAADGDAAAGDGTAAAGTGEWSSESSGAGSLSPLRLEAAAAAAADDLEQRLHRALNTSHCPKGVFDAQPTASERQRENLSSRLRREFGLALPDDEESRPPTETPDGASAAATAAPSAGASEDPKLCER